MPFLTQRNCVFATNSYFLTPVYLQPNVEAMNYVRSNNLSLTYQEFTPSGYTIGIRKFNFVAKTHAFRTEFLQLLL